MGDLFSELFLYCNSMNRGPHKRLMRMCEGWGIGVGLDVLVRGQGQMSRSQREKHIAFHQPAEEEVIHNSVDTIPL